MVKTYHSSIPSTNNQNIYIYIIYFIFFKRKTSKHIKTNLLFQINKYQVHIYN